jgi:hypothetical protein
MTLKSWSEQNERNLDFLLYQHTLAVIYVKEPLS